MKLKNCLIWVILLLYSCSSSKQVSYSRAELKKRTFHYFWDLADKNNYQIPDRYPSLTFSSIAATGFGLTSYIVGVHNGYISRKDAAQRTLQTLETLWNLPQGPDEKNVSGYKGFYYHFLTLDEAKRFKDVELSSIDTGLLMAGILSSQSFFNGDNEVEKKIRYIADSLYRRVEWDWMMTKNNRLSMGWHPEKGFIPSEWRGYNEAMILLVLAMGSPTHSIPSSAWQSWCDTYEYNDFMGKSNIQFDPLFGHQYSHVWLDFRNITDAYTKEKNTDYFINSQKATISNKSYCVSNPMQFKGYGENLWGLTACDGPYNGEKNIDGKVIQFFDYRARGAASTQIEDDGTIAPTAAGGSFPFTPIDSENALKFMWENYNKDLIGKYGFKDAFNLTYRDEVHKNGWFDIDYLGIDQGPILLQIENHESQLIWNIMKKNPYIVNGLKKAGFTGGWLDNYSMTK